MTWPTAVAVIVSVLIISVAWCIVSVARVQAHHPRNPEHGQPGHRCVD